MSEERGTATAASDSALGLSASLVFVDLSGDEGASSLTYVQLKWNFDRAVSLIDWIGLFQTGEYNPLLYMDYKNYGVCGSKSGMVDWKLTSSHFSNKNNKSKESEQNDLNNNSVCFKYYDGLTGAVRATSLPLLVYSDAQILVHSIMCKELRSSHKSRYYAKIGCSGKRTCVYRTTDSSEAYWKDLKFLFPADRSSELRFAIKERRWTGDHTLGLLNIPIIDLVQRRNQNLAFVLRTLDSSHDINNNNPCQVVVSCKLIPQQKQSYADTINSLTVSTAGRTETNECVVSDRVRLLNVGRDRCPASSLGSSSSQCTMSNSSSNETNSEARPYTSFSADSSRNMSNAIASIPHLPKGWEVRADRYGRLIYIDHINKRTTWHPPAILENKPIRNEKGYVCARYTVSNPIDGNMRITQDVRKASTIGEEDASDEKSSGQLKRRVRIVESQRGTAENPAALIFLQRNDFLSLLQANTAALKLYNEGVYLKHIIHWIRKDPSKFGLFERNRELVAFVNSFADQTQPLPSGWQTARHCSADEQRLFIDHKSKQITLIDPRLPVQSTQSASRRRTRSEPATNRNARSGGRETRTCDVWDLLNRSDELQEIINQRFPEMAPILCRKLQLIGRMGEAALLQFANDLDFVAALSFLEQNTKLATTTTEYEENLAYFYSSLQKTGYGQGPGKIHFQLRRSHLMNDAYDKILSIDSNRLRKCQMSVTFDEEDGLDYGGPSRELFFLLSRDLFNPYYGLFEYSADNTYTVQISPISKFVDNYLQWMELCGRVLGLALIHRFMIDTFFTRAFYKFLLRIPYTISDLKTMDPQFHNSLTWIRDNKVTSDLDLTFSATEEVGGQIVEKELLPDGKDVLVTESNKEEYISLMLRWRVERSVGSQSQALLRGLYSVVDQNYLRIFNAEQLELVLSGTMEINIEDWRKNTEYKGAYYDGHIVVKWFWQTVYSFNNADRLKLLQFVTGTSSVPYEGFKALRGSNGLKMFTIEKWGSEQSLPRAHTCFNCLDLPSYPTQRILGEKLRLAIYESSCYSIE